MAKAIGPLMSVNATQKFANTLVFQRGRGGSNIVRLYKVPKNPQTVGQMTQRQKMAAGGKAIKSTGAESAGATFLKTKVVGEGTYATVISSSVIETFDDVKAYIADTENAAVVGAFQTAALGHGTEPARTFGASLPEFSAGAVLISLYLAFSRNQHPTLNHSLSTLVAGDAAALIGVITHS